MESSDEAIPFRDETEFLDDDEVLFRRVSPTWFRWDDLDEDGYPRIKSGAFQDYKKNKALEMGYPGPCMSVGIGSVLDAEGHDCRKMLEPVDETYGLAFFTVGDCRSNDQGVMRRPTKNEPWHGVVFSTVGEKRTGGMQGAIGDAARWIIPPHRPN